MLFFDSELREKLASRFFSESQMLIQADSIDYLGLANGLERLRTIWRTLDIAYENGFAPHLWLCIQLDQYQALAFIISDNIQPWFTTRSVSSIKLPPSFFISLHIDHFATYHFTQPLNIQELNRTQFLAKSSTLINYWTMGLMWTKHWGGRHAGLYFTLQISMIERWQLSGGGVVVDKHGARRAPFRFSLGRFSCFR